MNVLGIHHVTAIAGNPQRNVDFYGGVLGMRMVKRTVNFDDPLTYHFYFGDERGTPGSLVTFFPWPRGTGGRVGAGQVAVMSLAIAPGALGFWLERLVRSGIPFEGPTSRNVRRANDERVLSFRDPDGIMVELVATSDAGSRAGWGGAHDIPLDRSIRGVHGVTLWVDQGGATERVLADQLGFRPIGDDGSTRHYECGSGGSGALVSVRSVGGFPEGTEGVGTVHHIAWRAADGSGQRALRDAVTEAGLHPTEVYDRQYFHSIYFREPGGVLFEIATDGPGFGVDEAPGELGTRLMLPPRYKGRRGEIEAALPEIHPPGSSPIGGIEET